MKRKQKRDDLRKNLVQRRQTILSGDRLIAKAESLEAASATDAKRGRQKLREAALFYESAARAFQRATLGLSAKASWGRARACYECLTDVKCAMMCQEHQDSIDAIWMAGDAEQA